MIRIAISLLLAFLILPACKAQTKRALLIGISNYDTKHTLWNPIHGTNDVALLKTALMHNGMTDITELRDSHATYGAICSAFSNLINATTPGDIIYIHLSGHGQPVEDYDGDEKGKDKWDEAFIPYDAPKRYSKGMYEGEHHFTDDVLNRYIEKLRFKAGSKGMIYFSIDACHSGDSYRDEGDNDSNLQDSQYDTISPEAFHESDVPTWSTCNRGSAEGFSRHGKIYSASEAIVQEFILLKQNSRQSPLVMMESCLSTQRSYEIKLRMQGKDFYCGPLSLTIYKTLMNGRNLLTHNADWVKYIKTAFTNVIPGNNPQRLVIETTEHRLCR